MQATAPPPSQTLERPTASQLEEARQLRDLVLSQLQLNGYAGAIAIASDDAYAIVQLLTESIEAADRMGAT
ncbi:hypothetical protein U8335_03880 [Roseiconus lacunae]|uniref:Uncharacterized protein n=1 Tax=Roseiconus lacunae TaxID=2605694 RepID=A0ABT7PHK9_9BACT|nr:hypothetical protein [Roseiconus lacunae]MDM4015987.1 hypothetical protein [Roseiconus lacunae]WRQ51681.1 hypothetical protein U8335_03880 [Stieleria sp. HD01]